MDNKEENIVLSVKDLSVSFKQNKQWNEVTHKVNFYIRRGEILGLVGESGSGKSVSSLAVMGLLDKKIAKITNGEFVFSGKNKAMIFQEPMTALNPVKKCGPQVDEMLLTNTSLTKKEAKERTLRLFEEVLLPDVKRVYNSYPHSLSGGQRQRVMIAMALSVNPELLIADEPTTALDVTVQKTVLQLLKSLQQKHNMAVLFISHDLGVVKSISDRIAVIYKGSIVEMNDARSIFTNPQHIYTKSLIASRPPLDYKPERLMTVNDFMTGNISDVNYKHSKSSAVENKESNYRTTPLENGTPLLEVKDLQIDYVLKRNFFGKVTKSFHAIDNVGFEVMKGETLGLVGESGCGKTTVGRAVTRLINISSGNIIFEGRSLDKMTRSEKHNLRKDIQIIFQDPYSSLNPRKTIGAAIEEPMQVFGLYNSEQRRNKASELLIKTGLNADFYSRYPHQLSGGQRQRVGIARALALNPKLIICDESVSALDVSVQAQVLNLLNDLKRDFGFTYIFISHDLSVVKYMSDRIIVMQKGKIIEQGDAEQIYNNPKEEYTKKLIDSVCI
ncbi:MAG: ABC transporter ATP-binding protein [Bacteroidales bacterium]|nr:ABC transporter ATP-binding protein [Bacteroidales bacterium]